MNRLLPVLIAFALPLCAPAQSLAEYLKLRSAWKIAQPVSVDSLQKLVGAKVVEIKGTVKGSIRVGDSVSLMLERSDGGTLVVEGNSIPDWLEGNEVNARLLVRAERPHEMGEVRARLIAAAPERAVADAEAKMKPPAPKAPPKGAKSSRSKANPFSNGGNPLSGPIGKGSGAVTKTKPKEWILPASQATPYYAAFIKKRNKRLSDAEAMQIAQGVIGFSLHYKVDARLIMAMVLVESNFNPSATSRAGAQGLGQLMPGTARGLGVQNPYDSIENLYGTVRTVRGHLERYKKSTGDDFRSLVLMLAAYNAGSGAVRRHGGVPPYRETQAYIQKVTSLYYKLCGY
jgi:hypothetical protein